MSTTSERGPGETAAGGEAAPVPNRLRRGTVLLAVDGTEPSTTAARAALRIYGRDFSFVVVHVVRDADGPDERREAWRRAASVVAEPAEVLGPDTEIRIVQGRPGPAICGVADDVGALAIVMGHRPRRPLDPRSLRSVCRHVSRRAGRPVMVIDQNWRG